jgi:hypothetical protein
MFGISLSTHIYRKFGQLEYVYSVFWLAISFALNYFAEEFDVVWYG